MFDLQTELDNRLSDLKAAKVPRKSTGNTRALKKDHTSKAYIKKIYIEAGLMTRSGKLKKFKIDQY